MRLLLWRPKGSLLGLGHRRCSKNLQLLLQLVLDGVSVALDDPLEISIIGNRVGRQPLDILQLLLLLMEFLEPAPNAVQLLCVVVDVVVDVVVVEPSSAAAPAPAPAPPRRQRGLCWEPGILEPGRMFANLKKRDKFAGWSLECKSCRYCKTFITWRAACNARRRNDVFLAWETECPGEWQEHRDQGGKLLCHYA